MAVKTAWLGEAGSRHYFEYTMPDLSRLYVFLQVMQGRIQDWSEGGGGVPKVANVK